MLTRSLCKILLVLLSGIARSPEPEMTRVVFGYRSWTRPDGFNAQISKIEIPSEGACALQPPEQVAQPIIAIRKPGDYLRSLDSGSVWRHAEDAVQIHMAISL